MRYVFHPEALDEYGEAVINRYSSQQEGSSSDYLPQLHFTVMPLNPALR